VPNPTKDRTRAGANLNVWLPNHLVEAFETLCAEESRTKTAQLTIILREYLRQQGRLPPPPA